MFFFRQVSLKHQHGGAPGMALGDATQQAEDDGRRDLVGP